MEKRLRHRHTHSSYGQSFRVIGRIRPACLKSPQEGRILDERRELFSLEQALDRRPGALSLPSNVLLGLVPICYERAVDHFGAGILRKAGR